VVICNPFLAEIDELYRGVFRGVPIGERSTYLKHHYFPESFLTFGLDHIQQLIHLGLGKTDGFLDGKGRKDSGISLGKSE
jgi:hypothetical protein